jgi:hypothetical protein
MVIRFAAAVFICQFAFILVETHVGAVEPLQFNRDIRPILANHCLTCHGPDSNTREADLRLDLPEKAIIKNASGAIAIVPGKPTDSELVRRIFSEDASEVMPPPDSNRALTGGQKEALRRWVAEGAIYQPHWSFIPTQRPSLPTASQTAWPRNGIDSFILDRLDRADLKPAPPTDATTLIRRLSLDLTGLPPALADVHAFVSEMTAAGNQGSADETYARWVDRYLASPHYGERMAVDWMDAARYADTNGYQVDRDREIYAWRDWVINAFNANQPFDEFTIEQLAGDLLPNATLQQKIATGFNRNHMLNEEGGVIPEEFLAEYCADRVETTATVWLGQTFLCARCHDHKFDPFTQRDFYSLYAFFHNVTESGLGNYFANIRRNAPPMLKLPSPELDAKIAALRTDQAAARQKLTEIESQSASELADWESRLRQSPIRWQTAQIIEGRVADNVLTKDENRTSFSIAALAPGTHAISVAAHWPSARISALRLDWETPTGDASPTTVTLQIGKLRVLPAEKEGPGKTKTLPVRAAETIDSIAASELVKALDPSGKTQATLSAKAPAHASVIEFTPALSDSASAGVRIEFSLEVTTATPTLELRVAVTDVEPDSLIPAAVDAILKKESKDRAESEQKQLVTFRLSKNSEHRALTDRIAQLTTQIDEADLQIPTTLVMDEMPKPRTSKVLIRGAYDQHGETVTANTPASLPGMSPELPKNRLGLARWLVDPANPLTARVTVNRLWQSLFGIGLVRTAEDFGTQGEPPSHPELLDWLADEFVRSGWDLKRMVRLMVTSATYRQSSRFTGPLLEHDPENRLLARGPRFRLQAEFLRDQALAASGLLVTRIGGPSVKPYHPPDLYEQVSTGPKYTEGTGDDLYRRSIYTYWKRSVPHPAMFVFDAPFRETCTMRRARTNTPLQALNLMNDPTYMEAARFLAEKMLADGGPTRESQLTYGFRLVLARAPRPAELAVLVTAYDRAKQDFQNDAASTADLLKTGSRKLSATLDQTQLAALTIVASTILNLDETVMKE